MAALNAFEFEKPIVEIESQIEELRKRSSQEDPGDQVWIEIKQLEEKLAETKFHIYTNLNAWQRVQLARHLDRPHAMDYIGRLVTRWTEIHGDRLYGDDRAMVAGIGYFAGRPVAVIGQQKGKDTKENVERNFGMPHPEGYRKAMRVMKLAEKFHLPVIALIDTPGAYPGVGAEERGQAEAIARNIMEMSLLKTPIICCVLGEGASGGALGIGVGDAVMMFENSWYCVISPEGCAAILWRDSGMAQEAAKSLKLTARDLMELKVIDEIVPEPLGGAHRNWDEASYNLKSALARQLDRLTRLDTETLLEERYAKYRRMGQFGIDDTPLPTTPVLPPAPGSAAGGAVVKA